MLAFKFHSAQIRYLRSFEIRFELESAIPILFESDGLIRKFLNRRCLCIACHSQMTRTINGAYGTFPLPIISTQPPNHPNSSTKLDTSSFEALHDLFSCSLPSPLVYVE